MPRPREFEPEEMLDRAVLQFWRHGYAGLGVGDLLTSIGLSRASMYATYGSKADFYEQALDRYRHVEGGMFRSCLEDAGSAIEAVERVFDLIVEQSLDEQRPRGCFVVSACGERVPDDPRTSRQVQEELNALCGIFDQRFGSDRADGLLPADFATRRWARFVVSNIQGLRVMAAAQPQRDVLEDVARGVVEALRDAGSGASPT